VSHLDNQRGNQHRCSQTKTLLLPHKVLFCESYLEFQDLILQFLGRLAMSSSEAIAEIILPIDSSEKDIVYIVQSLTS